MTAATNLFALSLLFVLYVLLGYPLIILLAARLWPKPIRKDGNHTPDVSVLLPVHNGRHSIAAKLENLLSGLDYPAGNLEVVVISDESDDGTDEIVRGFDADPRLRYSRIKRGGKAAALNRGLELARGEVLFLTDVRQPLERQCLRNLTACFADETVGAVSGELMIISGETHEEQHIGLYWRYEKLIRKSLSSLGSVFGATGAVYAIRRDLARPLPPYTLDDDVFLPLCAFFGGKRVVLEDAALAYDYPTTLHVEFQRKVRTLAGVYQTVGFFPSLLWPGTRGWFHFMSHKFGRLLLPWALAAAAVSSWWLPQPWRSIAMAGEACFAAMALLDRVIPERWPVKRVTSMVRTFLVLMAATATAATILFRPASSFWKPARTPAPDTAESRP
jgi:cellulose synthase/poly-beta-1,6-N-acetylglucosamine synthase-like glycosyltransferase